MFVFWPEIENETRSDIALIKRNKVGCVGGEGGCGGGL